MKGPSLRYDLRVLRGFACDACGRTIQAPAHVTSHTCMCSDPPKFMRPIERPRTVSPDVSRFITLVDPAEEIEEDVDEVPYVVHVPVKPPPPARFANRRKLYDDSAIEEEPDFGAGVVSDSGSNSTSIEEPTPELRQDETVVRTETSPDNAVNESAGAENDRSRRSRRGRRGDGGRPNSQDRTSVPQNRSPNRGPGPNRSQPGNQQNRDVTRDDSTQGAGIPSTEMDAATNVRTSEVSDDSSADDESATENSSTPTGEGRPRRSRRRGRRRGPRPEGDGK